MINYRATFSSYPDSYMCIPLPDGDFDVWIRKNIYREEYDDADSDATSVIYVCDEAYARLDIEPVITDENFDEVFEFVKEWSNTNKEESDKENYNILMQIRADLDYIAMEVGVDL